MKSSTRSSISTFSLVAAVITIIILNACDTKFKQNCLATCQSKDMSEDVIWCWFTTFNSPDSLLDAVSAQFPSTSSYFPVFGCFKWVKVLYIPSEMIIALISLKLSFLLLYNILGDVFVHQFP